MSWIAVDVYLWCLIGIVISAVLPGVWAYVRLTFPADPSQPKTMPVDPWQLAKPYVALCAASALTALLLVAFLGESLTEPSAAILAGYAWDSTLQKLR
jgi:TRAP-type C4-dicarboxylate transport system permease small subunit